MFFSPKSHGSLILTIEVQSSMVRGSLVWLKSGAAKPEVLFIGLRDVPYRPGMKTGRFVQTTMQEVGEVIDAVLQRLYSLRSERAAEHIPRHISEAHYILSSPWMVCQARTLSLPFERDTKVSRAKITSILDDERSRMAPSADGPTEIIEEKIFEVRLNGYPVAAWQDKPARELEISYALGVAGTSSLAHFQEACRRVVGPRRVQFHSSLLLQYVALRETLPERMSYTLIHVHGELTDVVLVDHGACSFFGSYPFGIRSAVRTIAEGAKGDEEAADSLLSLYTEKRLEDKSAAQSADVMKKASDKWIAQFKDILKQGQAESRQSPDTIIAARFHEQFFADSFRTAYPSSRVELLALDSVLSRVDYGSGSLHQRIVGLYALAIHSLKEGRLSQDMR